MLLVALVLYGKNLEIVAHSVIFKTLTNNQKMDLCMVKDNIGVITIRKISIHTVKFSDKSISVTLDFLPSLTLYFMMI